MTDVSQETGPYFGEFGGRFIPEALIPALDEIEETWRKSQVDPAFTDELLTLQRNYIGRPSLLTEATRFAEHCGGARVFLKREDLNHTGSHKINNALAQALLAKRMGKTRVIAETGAGQHGVATATAAALLDMSCVVYMGEEDTQRQALNVARMRLLGATVNAVTNGTRTLKDAMNEAMRDWVANVDDTHYVIGTVAGPHPFPAMVRSFQNVIGVEAREQIQDMVGRLPDAVCACVGGGSNAMGLFAAFLGDADVKIFGFEAGGEVDSGHHAARFSGGRPGVLHGSATTSSGTPTDRLRPPIRSRPDSTILRSVPTLPPPRHRPGDLPTVVDDEAMEAMRLLSRTEGIIPAIESAHALAGAMRIGRELDDAVLQVNLSGRGDRT